MYIYMYICETILLISSEAFYQEIRNSSPVTAFGRTCCRCVAIEQACIATCGQVRVWGSMLGCASRESDPWFIIHV